MVDSGEVWKTLKQGGELFRRYKISSYGRVWDCKNATFVSHVITGKPQYFYVNLYSEVNAKRVLRRVHNCMAWTFLGDPAEGETSDHIDVNRFNNSLINLRWASKKTQMRNRGATLKTKEGLPILSALECAGYVKPDMLKQYLYGRMVQGDTLEEAIFNRGEFLQPNHKLDTVDSYGVEFDGVWYPNKRTLCKYKGNCGVKVLRSRLKEGMNLEEALTYEYVNDTAYKYLIDGIAFSAKDHCERLNVSYARVYALVNKHGIPFETAILEPAQRIIKHNINGKTLRNSDWAKHYNIPPRNFNGTLCRHKKVGKTFRDSLHHYDIDTSSLEIYPCDGEVVMYNRPI